MSEITVLVMPLDDGFRALIGGSLLDSYTFDGFGSTIESALRQNLGNDIEVEYVLSPEIRAQLAACTGCKGAGEVEIPGTVAAQILANEFSMIDYSKRATDTCPRCKGSRAEMPHFWRRDS